MPTLAFNPTLAPIGSSVTLIGDNTLVVDPWGGAPAMSQTALPMLFNNTSTQTPDFTIDDSAAVAGDRLLLVFGTGEGTLATMTVGGADVGANIANTGSGSTGAMLWVFEHVYPGAGSASTTVVATTAGTQARHSLSAVLIKGATRDDVAIDYQFNIGTATAPVTPASSTNLITAFATGRASFFGAHTFTNVTQEGATATNASNDRTSAIAFNSDVPAAELSVQFDPDPGGDTSDEVTLVAAAYS